MGLAVARHATEVQAYGFHVSDEEQVRGFGFKSPIYNVVELSGVSNVMFLFLFEGYNSELKRQTFRQSG